MVLISPLHNSSIYFFSFEMGDPELAAVWLGFIISAAVILIGIYVAFIKRNETSKQDSPQKSSDTDWNLRALGEPVIRGRSLLGEERNAYASARFEGLYPYLLEKLNEYYDNYVKIPEQNMSIAQSVVKDVKSHVLDYFLHFHPELNITEMKDTGSCREGLKVIRPDEFDIMFYINLDRRTWEFVHSLDNPNFFEVRKIGSGDSPYDQYILNRYLSPWKLGNDFHGKIQRAVNMLELYSINLERHGPAITLKVRYGEGKKVYIDFVPGVKMGSKVVVPKPHKRVPEYAPPHIRHAGDESRLWRQSFSEEECTLISENLPPECCYLKVLKIFKAVRLNAPSQFGMLSSYVYKTVLMHMIRSSRLDATRRWAYDNLEERFIEFLDALQQYLSDGRLPHFFNSDINLLEDFSDQSCENLQRYIKYRVGEKEITEMLKLRGYSGIL